MVSGAVAQDKRVRGVGGVGDFSGKRWNDRRMDREWARAGDGRKRVVFRSGNGVGRGEAAEGRSLVDGGQHPLMIPSSDGARQSRWSWCSALGAVLPKGRQAGLGESTGRRERSAWE